MKSRYLIYLKLYKIILNLYRIIFTYIKLFLTNDFIKVEYFCDINVIIIIFYSFIITVLLRRKA